MHVSGSIGGDIVLLKHWPMARDPKKNVWLRVAELRFSHPGNIQRAHRVNGHSGCIEAKEQQAALDTTHVKPRVVRVPGVLLRRRRGRERLGRSSRVCLSISP